MTKRKFRYEEDHRIREPALVAALKANPQLEIEIVGRRPMNGCLLRAHFDHNFWELTSARNKDRVFASIDAAALYAKRLGVTVIKLDLSKYEAGRVRASRPDRANALRQLHAPSLVGRQKPIKP